MSKLIKLTDEVGALLANKAMADGVTMAEEVRRLLTGDKTQEVIDRLNRIEELLSNMSAAQRQPEPASDNENIVLEASDEPEIVTDKTYDELVKEMTEVKKELDSDDLDDGRRKELESELRGLLVELAAAEQ